MGILEGFGDPKDTWPAQFNDFVDCWTKIPLQQIPSVWTVRFDEATTFQNRLVQDGQWVSGPRSLLGVLGLRHREVSHSKVLAWLLDPTGQHGFGGRFLAAFLERAGLPSDSASSRVRVTTEEQCFDPANGDCGFVDIIVRGSDWTLVIENKIWAGQHGKQLELYYDTFMPDAVFVFLTPDGIPARSPRDEVANAFLPLSWRREVISDIERTLAGQRPPAVASTAVIDYLAALKEEFLV